MKVSQVILRVLQVMFAITLIWGGMFVYNAITFELPEGLKQKVESEWDEDDASLERLRVYEEFLLNLRQGGVTAFNVDEVKNLFYQDDDKKQIPPIMCETCGKMNDGNAVICVHCGSAIYNLKVDTDGDGMPDFWEIQYQFDPEDPNDATMDCDEDGISNLEEFIEGTHPCEGYDSQSADLPFELIKTYQKPIQILFMGYILLPNGSLEVQINWGGKTEFYKPGDEIRGYTIKSFEKVIDTVPTQTGVPRYVDNSFIICQKRLFTPKKFVKQKIVTETDIFASIQFAGSLESSEVHIDYKLKDPVTGRVFTVVDIGLKPPKIIVEDEEKKNYTVQPVRKNSNDLNL